MKQKCPNCGEKLNLENFDFGTNKYFPCPSCGNVYTDEQLQFIEDNEEGVALNDVGNTKRKFFGKTKDEAYYKYMLQKEKLKQKERAKKRSFILTIIGIAAYVIFYYLIFKSI